MMRVEKTPKQVAVEAVADMLKWPENLEKLDQLRQRTRNKMDAVHTRLKTTVQSQLDDVKQGITRLQQARTNIGDVKGNLASVTDEYNACRGLREYTEKTRALSQQRDELRHVLEQIDRIFTVPEEVICLRSEVIPETTESGQVTSHPNLLATHQRIAQLEECRDSMLKMMQKHASAASIQKTILTYFENVHVLAEQLSMRLLSELSEPLELVQESPTRMVTWLRIIEKEERNDMHAAPSQFRPKLLRNKFLDKWEMAIELRFDTQLGTLRSVDNFLKRVDSFYFSDLKVAMTELDIRFPPHYEIASKYLEQYHTRLFAMVEQLKESHDIDPSEIMSLLRWVPKYKDRMQKELDVDVTQRFPDKLMSRSGGESAMRAQYRVAADGVYIDMLRTKLDSWCNNLIATEVEPWFVITEEEPAPPQTNLEGLYYSDAPKILFQMIDQQIDVAFSPGNPISFVQALLDACMKTLERFVSDYTKSVRQCRDMYVGPTPSERPELLVEYMMTCGNNTIQICEYFIPQLREKVDELQPEELVQYRMLERPCARAVRELTSIASACNDVIVDIFMTDVQKHCDALLTAKWLRSKIAVKTIVATLTDYVADFKDHLQSSLLSPLIHMCWVRLLLEYVKGFIGKRFVLKNKEDREEYVTRLKEEVDELYELVMEDLESDERSLRLQSAIHSIAHISMSKPSMLLPEWKSLRSNFPDATIHHFEAILLVREDMGAKEVKKAINEQIIKKSSDSIDPRSNTTGTPFFSLVPVSTATDYSASAAAGKDKK